MSLYTALCAMEKRKINLELRTANSGPSRVVGIAYGYGLDGPGIESRWRRGFPHLSRPALGPTQPPVQWVPGLYRSKERPGRDADHSPPSSTVFKKEYSYTSTPPMGRTTCTEPQCLYKGALYLSSEPPTDMTTTVHQIKKLVEPSDCGFESSSDYVCIHLYLRVLSWEARNRVTVKERGEAVPVHL